MICNPVDVRIPVSNKRQFGRGVLDPQDPSPSLQDTSISHLFLLTYIMIIIWHLSLTVRVSFSSSGVLLALFLRRLFIFIDRFCSFSPCNCSILIWQKFHILSQSTQLIKCARVIFFLSKQGYMGIPLFIIFV